MSFFSSFFPNGGVCAFIHSDVQSSRLPQFDLANPGFQIVWMKVSLPKTSKFICTLYHTPNSTNHELLFNHLSKTIDTITLQSPCSEITVGNRRFSEYLFSVCSMATLLVCCEGDSLSCSSIRGLLDVIKIVSRKLT